MRSLFSLIIFLSISATTFAQSQNPVTWDFEIQKDGKDYIILAKAEVEESWVLYSHYTAKGGPIGTTLEINPNQEGVTKLEELEEEGTMIREHSDMFDLDVSKFKKEVVFKQKIKVSDDTSIVSGFVRFMTCDDKKCLPPTNIDFSLSLN